MFCIISIAIFLDGPKTDGQSMSSLNIDCQLYIRPLAYLKENSLKECKNFFVKIQVKTGMHILKTHFTILISIANYSFFQAQFFNKICCKV